MKESDARKKWCPMTRVPMSNEPMTGNHAANRFPGCSEGWHQTRCIASDCMMWEWDKFYGSSTGGIDIAERSKTEGHCTIGRR